MVKISKFKFLLILLMCLVLFFINNKIIFANEQINVSLNKSELKINENVEAKINVINADIASCKIEIYFDQTKLQYISGPDNSNFSNERILYTWVSDTGENVKNIEIGTFIFRTQELGYANLVVSGEFYNSEGQQINISNNITQIQIKDENENKQNQVEQSKINTTSDNTNLSVLRINHEGISPDFNTNIKEYYFIANNEINSLEITAIPENINSKITITGNNELKLGKNIIEIKVQSEDNTKTSIYKIYVTKTENIEMANANLQTLAIRQTYLSPEFDNNITYYKAEIANNISKIDLLAIPQNQSATVKIEQNDEIQIGNNQINIIVTAEDGITNKKYIIDVYRRNEQEEIEYEKEQKIEAEKLSAILEENENNSEQNIIKENENQNKFKLEDNEYNNNVIRIVVFFIVIGLVVIVRLIYIKTKNRKNK